MAGAGGQPIVSSPYGLPPAAGQVPEAERFRALSSEWHWVQDIEGRFTYLSPGAREQRSLFPTGAVGCTLNDLGLQWEDDHMADAHASAIARRSPFTDLVLSDAMHARHIGMTGSPLFDATGACIGYFGTARDMTGSRRAEARNARLHDCYTTISEANAALIHDCSTEVLLPALSRIALGRGRFSCVRILLLEPGGRGLSLTAGAGADPGLYAIEKALDDGPVCQALRTGATVVGNDLLHEVDDFIGREALRRSAVRAHAACPLRRNDRLAGVLEAYSAHADCFDEALTGMLEQLAAIISFALDNVCREEARRAAELALRESEHRFRDFAEAAGEFVWEIDHAGRFVYLSSGVQALWEYTDQELIGRNPLELTPPGEAKRVRQWLRENTQADGSYRDLEFEVMTRSGEMRWVIVHAVAIADDQGRRIGQRGTCRNITDRKQAHARMSYLATRDALTELPNRVLFNDRLQQGIVAARRNGHGLAVLFIDLDRFKGINDSLGHGIGDLLLKAVAARMLGCIRKGDTLSRLGGDEFVATLEGLQQAEDAAQVADKIIRALARPFDLGGHTLRISCSIGIASFPYDADDGRGLMQNADTAMYHAKQSGRNNYQFFSSQMNARALERLRLETELRQALPRRQFVLHYQPRADLRTGRLIGVEALLRWRHPEQGLLAPQAFVGVAEECGMMESIGYWVVQEACRQARQWQQAGYHPVRVSVNISGRELSKSRRLVRSVFRVLSLSGLDPRCLTLDISESLLLDNPAENIPVLRRLGDKGVRIAVDDFGAGRSSLAILRQLPVESLKIDKGLVRGMLDDAGDLSTVRAIIALAHSLGMLASAEGVESQEQLETLAALGCDEHQGNLLSQPLPEEVLRSSFLVQTC